MTQKPSRKPSAEERLKELRDYANRYTLVSAQGEVLHAPDHPEGVLVTQSERHAPLLRITLSSKHGRLNIVLESDVDFEPA
jgi:hypothetical protein